MADRARMTASAGADQSAAKRDIVQTAVAAGKFKTLASLLSKAGLAGTLKGKGPYTVFAPTDAAFAKVPKSTLDALGKDKAKLRAVLLYHVASGRLTAASEYLGYARALKVADLPYPALVRLAAELRRQLGQVLDVMATGAATRVTPDGSASLSAVDVQTVLGALADAAWWQAQHGTPERAARYRSLARSLGDDR